MKIGKHGGQKPTETILGNPIESHFHKMGLDDGYYVVVENQPIENLDELLADMKKEVKKLGRVGKPKSKPTTKPKDEL